MIVGVETHILNHRRSIMWRTLLKLTGLMLVFGTGYVTGRYSWTAGSTEPDNQIKKKNESLKRKEEQLREKEASLQQREESLKEREEKLQRHEESRTIKAQDEKPDAVMAVKTAQRTEPVTEAETAEEKKAAEAEKEEEKKAGEPEPPRDQILHDLIQADNSFSVFGLITDPDEIVDKGLGEKIIHWASAAGAIEVTKVLISTGADVNVKDINGTTPLHSAIINGKKAVAELLIENGAELNAVTSSGQTPLHCAVSGDLRELVELLLSSGAEINFRNKTGKKPLDIAMEIGNNRIINLLRTHIDI